MEPNIKFQHSLRHIQRWGDVTGLLFNALFDLVRQDSAALYLELARALAPSMFLVDRSDTMLPVGCCFDLVGQKESVLQMSCALAHDRAREYRAIRLGVSQRVLTEIL